MHSTSNSTDIGEKSDENNIYVSNEENSERNENGNTENIIVNQLPCLHMLYLCSDDGKHSRLTPNFKMHTATSYTKINPESKKKEIADASNTDTDSAYD